MTRRIVDRITNWREWVRGLIGALVGGGANAVTVMLVKPSEFNFQNGWTSLWQFTAVSALVSAALYLKQHPVPEREDEPPAPKTS